MNQSQLLEIIEKVAPLTMQAAWDASGMQVAGAKEDIKILAVCLDPVPAAIEAAVKGGADMVLSHHPLLMKPRLPAVIDAYHHVLSLLFKHDVALYAAHTSLDVNPNGPVAWLASELGLGDIAVIEPVGSQALGFGYGVCGRLARPAPFAEFIKDVMGKCALSSASICGSRPETVASVAICPGSGASMSDLAAGLGADIFITGDVKYHAALEAQLCVLDVGHHCLEEEMMRRFSLLLQKAAPEVTVNFISSASPLSSVLL